MFRVIIFLFFALTTPISGPGAALAHDAVWPGEKLKKLAPDAVSFEQRNLYLNDRQRKGIETTIGHPLPPEDLRPSIYFVIKRSRNGAPRRDAVIIFIDARGQNGKIEIGIVVNADGGLIRAMIFENREPPGILTKEVLRKFAGKDAATVLSTGIAAKPGTEKSTQALKEGIGRGLLIINSLFGR